MRQALSPRITLLAVAALLLWDGRPARGGELRPTLSAGYAHVADAHAAIVGSLRFHVRPRFFLQGEYVALPGDGHTDHGPALQIGVSSAKATGLRPYLAIGVGPVVGLDDDDGLAYGALGVSCPLGGRGRLFVQPEVRVGILGETGYAQLSVGIGFMP